MLHLLSTNSKVFQNTSISENDKSFLKCNVTIENAQKVVNVLHIFKKSTIFFSNLKKTLKFKLNRIQNELEYEAAL